MYYNIETKGFVSSLIFYSCKRKDKLTREAKLCTIIAFFLPCWQIAKILVSNTNLTKYTNLLLWEKKKKKNTD